MSRSRRFRGVKVLKAVSSPLRLNILNLLFDRGSLSYTELMSALKMNPSRDAGRFAYHLKFLLKVDLIEADVEARKYRLTELGKMVINVAEDIERKSAKRKRILVRTSRFTLEDFDANKIVDSLVRETGMPVELAQKTAKEAEKRLLRSKTKYLTAPLIREVVNAILVEKGLEEHRHKLTRLGLPVHDITSLIEDRSRISQGSAVVHEEIRKVVMKEYTLLNILPRDIADAHLSGSLYINNLSDWILRPSEIMHDARFFLQDGLNLEKTNALQPSYPPPKSFGSALSMVLNVLLHSSREICESQTLDYFNVFLAPFAKKAKPSQVEEALRLFVYSVSQNVNVSIGLELSIPYFMAEEKAIGPLGRVDGSYEDFTAESQFIASSVLGLLAEESAKKPLSNPKIIVKIRSGTLNDGNARESLLKAHRLASEKGVPYFANMLEKSRRQDVFSASGCRLGVTLKGDWEIDTLRTGVTGCVAVNLPRIIYECEREEAKFFEILKERLEMAARALEIKYNMLRQHGRGLTPFMMQDANGDYYFRLKRSTHVIGFIGLREAAEAFCEGSRCKDGDPLNFAEETTKAVLDFTRKVGKSRRRRLLPAILPSFKASRRLVHLDIERYGIGKIQFSGTRRRPFYSTVTRLGLQDEEEFLKTLRLEKKLQGLHTGGTLTIVELEESKREPDDLVSLSRQLIETHGIRLFTYNRILTYCRNCTKSWLGSSRKCPSCGATSTLTSLTKFVAD